MRRHYKTRFPAANVPRWNEDVATDTLFSDIPAHDDGILWARRLHYGTVFYSGITSHFTKVYPMSSESQIPDTLCDLLRDHSYCNKAQQSNAFNEILHHYRIGQYSSEPYQQNQNHLNAAFKMSKRMSTLSWIEQAHHLNFGSYLPFLWSTYPMF